MDTNTTNLSKILSFSKQFFLGKLNYINNFSIIRITNKKIKIIIENNFILLIKNNVNNKNYKGNKGLVIWGIAGAVPIGAYLAASKKYEKCT